MSMNTSMNVYEKCGEREREREREREGGGGGGRERNKKGHHNHLALEEGGLLTSPPRFWPALDPTSCLKAIHKSSTLAFS